MKTSHTNSSVVRMHPRAPLENHELGRHLRSCVGKPLAIELDARRITSLLAYTDDVGALLQHELQLWRQILGQRVINSLEVHYFNQLIEPYQITGIIHRLATDFSINKPLYRVVIQPSDAEAEVLALFKGLAFDHCQFAVEQTDTNILEQLEGPFEAARSFQFSKIGVQLMHFEGMEHLTRTIKLLQRKFDFDYIYIGSSTHRLRPEDVMHQQVLFEDDVRSFNLDFLSLGPEARSTFKGRDLSALNSPERYIDAVLNEKLPIDEGGALRRFSR